MTSLTIHLKCENVIFFDDEVKAHATLFLRISTYFLSAKRVDQWIFKIFGRKDDH